MTTTPTDGPDETGEPDGTGEPDDLVDLVAGAVRDVPGVADLHSGVLDEVASYLPGHRVHGVRLRSPGCDVHVVLEWGAPVTGTTELVRTAVRELVGAGPVDVTVEDFAAPASPPPAPRSDLGP